MKYLILFSLFLIGSQSKIVASTNMNNNILESEDSTNSNENNEDIKFHSTDESILEKSRNTKYNVKQKRKKTLTLLQNSDLKAYIEKENNDLSLIIDHSTQSRCFDTDEQTQTYVNDFFTYQFDAFRALFVIPDKEDILNHLHNTFITHLSRDNLITIPKKLTSSDLRLQLWVFTRLMDLYTHEIYDEAKIVEKNDESEIRDAIVDLGKKINLTNPLTNENESKKPGIDYVGLIFKAVNLINYLPNATEESYYFTKLLHDIKLRVDLYINDIQGIKKNKKDDFVSQILDWYSNFSQTKYARQFHILQAAIKSIQEDINYQKKSLITFDRLIFTLIAACSGILANYGLTKTLIILKKIRKKIETAIQESELDAIKKIKQFI